MKKRLFTVLLSVVMAVALIPAASFAGEGTPEETGGSEVMEKIAAQLQDPGHDAFMYESPKKTMLRLDDDAGPDPTGIRRYDLRNEDCITPVKFQNPFGSCWGFAAIAAAESSIIGSGLAETDGLDKDTLDLSEKHLMYFVTQPISDPDDPQYGEGMHAEEGVTLQNMINYGGMPFMATSLFASGIGPNLESRDPSLLYKGKNGWVEKREIRGKVTDFCYDAEDDWSLPEDWRFKQSYVLKESFMLPSPAQVDEDKKTYKYNPAATDAIKRMLMSKRAVQIGFCADTSRPDQEGGAEYISDKWAHYTYDQEENANHAVTIVGWDDDFDKSNFVEGHQPPENGAWLVKNSWGTGERAFPNKGGGDWGILQHPDRPFDPETNVSTGYFWLSYYDRTLSAPEALDFDKSNVGQSYYIDEHDFMPVSEVNAIDMDADIRVANVFCAEECQRLEQVSCETTYLDTKVVNEVYLLPDGFTNPEQGVLIDRTEDTFKYGGFHKMDLESPDLIQKGQHYAVVQTMTIPTGEHVANMPLSYGKLFAQLNGEESWVEGVVNKNESFMYIDDKWNDYSDPKLLKSLFGGTQVMFSLDNFPIKGYATPAPNLKLKVVGETKYSIVNEEQKSGTLILRFTGDPGEDFDPPAITWELAEGGSKYFTLEQDPAHTDRVKLTAKDVGKTHLIVTAEGIGTSIIPITVSKLHMSAVQFAGEYVYTGKRIRPKVLLFDEMDNVIPASNYTITYSRNKKCGVGRMTIKAKAASQRYTGEYYEEFRIVPKRGFIRSAKPGKRKITVRVKNQKPSGVTKYRVKYRVKGSKKWKTKTFKATKKARFVLKGLKKGKRYQIKVAGFAPKVGIGKYSKVKLSKKVR